MSSMNPIDNLSKEFRQSFSDECKNEAFDTLKNYFENRDEFNNFVEKLSDSSKKFLRGAVFYKEALKQKRADIKLIMIISIIEAINSEEEFIDFKEWCDRQKEIELTDYDSFKELLKHLKEEYHKIHGCKQKTLTFFENYVIDKDKETLISYFKTEKNIYTEDKLSFKEIVDILYIMRNNFLHLAIIILTSDKESIQQYIKKNGKDFYVNSNIDIKEFEKIFERSFIRYFEEKIKPIK